MIKVVVHTLDGPAKAQRMLLATQTKVGPQIEIPADHELELILPATQGLAVMEYPSNDNPK